MDRYLGDSLFDPVFDELDRRKAVVFIHPTHCEAPEHTGLHAPPFAVEYVFDTTRAIVNLIYTGTLQRCPDIRFIVAHGGGAVPYLAERIAMMEGHRGAKNLTGVIPAIRALYYETASTTSAFALRSLQELADPERILWGSDLPFVYGTRLQREVDTGNTTTALTTPPAAPSKSKMPYAYFRASLNAAKLHPKLKRMFHHEGHEEHEVRNNNYPNPSCPSCLL